MIGLLLRFLKFAGSKIINPLKNFARIIKNPIKAIKKQLTDGVNVLSKAKKASKRIVSGANGAKKNVRRLSKNARLEDKIMERATLVDQLRNEQTEVLLHKSNVEITTSVQVEQIVETKGFLKTKTYEEKQDVLEAINKELDDLGLKSEEDITKAVESDEFFYEKVMENSYDAFMENWKNGFYAYNPADLGMSEDEREIVWQQILEEKNFAWYNNYKVRKTEKE